MQIWQSLRFPLTLIRLGAVYCLERPDLARDNDGACKQGDAAQPSRVDDHAQASNAVSSPQHAVDITEHAEALLRLTRKRDTSSTNHPADNVEREIRLFWQERGEDGDMLQKETKHFQSLLFHKKKYSVSEDLWFPAGSHRGESQHVEAVVSETFVLKQIKEVIELRETWLRQQNLPMDFQMRDGKGYERQ